MLGVLETLRGLSLIKYKRYGKIAGCIQSDGTVLYFERNEFV